MNDALALQHYDPVVGALGPTLKDLYSLYHELQRKVTRDQQNFVTKSIRGPWLLSKLADHLGKLDEFDSTCRFEEGEAGGVSFLLRNITELSQLFTKTLELLETVIREIKSENNYPNHTAHLLLATRETFDTLRARAKHLAPTHIVLQHHFEDFKLTAPGIGRLDDEELAVFLAPLAAVRDEYFINPRSELLTEYLRVAAAAALEPIYREFGVKASDGPAEKELVEKLEECTTQLEVLSMLDTVNYS